jgi:ribosomal protein L37AE/L43A
MGGKRLRFTDQQRRRLASKAKKVGQNALSQIGNLVTPDTLLRGYRQLIAKKYDATHCRRPGHPRTAMKSGIWSSKWAVKTLAGATPQFEVRSITSGMKSAGRQSRESFSRTDSIRFEGRRCPE